MKLFGRTWKVTIARQPTGFIGSNPQYFEQLGNAIEITALRMQFEVKKNLGREPNTCTIKLHNLAPTTRSELEHGALKATLHAGYDNTPRLLFTGDVRRVWSVRDGQNIITNLQVRDGMRAFAHARMDRSYRPPIEVHRVLADMAKSMGLELPPEIEQSAELRQALANGITTRGPTRDVLTRLLAPYGYGWSVQNGRLLILRDGDLKPGEAFLINTDTGLLGSPERTTPDKPGEPVEIKFDVRLYPELTPGSRTKLESEFLSVTSKIYDLKSVGDSRSGDWKTSVTGRPV